MNETVEAFFTGVLQETYPDCERGVAAALDSETVVCTDATPSSTVSVTGGGAGWREPRRDGKDVTGASRTLVMGRKDGSVSTGTEA